MTYHKQCKMSNEGRRYTAWLPEEYAKKGKVVRIDDVGTFTIDNVGTKQASSRIKELNDQLHKGIFGSIKKLKTLNPILL